MKRILFINDEMCIGGVENVLITILKNFNFADYQIDLLLNNPSTDLDREIPDHINIFYVNQTNMQQSNKIFRYVRGVVKELFPRRAKKIIKSGRYDCVIDFKGTNLSYLRKLKIPTVFWSHKDFSIETNPYEKRYVENYSKTPMGKFKSYFFKKSIDECDYIVCISKTMREHFVSRFGYEEKVRVIYNPIDTHMINEKSKEIVDDLHKKSSFTFCCVSRITEGKGIERLLNCVQDLNALGYNFSLVIVGDGDLMPMAIRQKESTNLSNVLFVGKKDNPYKYYKYSDAVIMPSENEAATLIVPESLIMGKTIIATDVGSTAEMLGKSEFGLLVPNSQEGIFNGMKNVMDNPNILEYYEKKNIDATEQFGTEKIMFEIKEFFDFIIEERRNK